MKLWQGTLGREYTGRNFVSLEEMESLQRRDYGMSRTVMNSQFLGILDRSLKILEIGCNIGNQLLCLQKMGFNNSSGIELQSHAIKIAKTRLKNIEIYQGSIFDLPFKSGSFDLIFTSSVLIHINSLDIKNALTEIYRCTRTYIWGFEYYAESCEEIIWHGKKGMLWRNDFVKLYQNQFENLKLIREKHFKYLHSGDYESSASMFLLEKK